MGSASRELVRREVENSISALSVGEHQYFARKLRMKDAWRAYEDFKHSCVYLDIETDGGPIEDGITAIGLYDGVSYECLLKGDSLESFRDRISNYSMIVTFFGRGFDLPVLQRRFPDVDIDQIHIDLCPTLRQLGFRGGLKKIEGEFGLTRSDRTVGLNGYDAIRLWRSYLRGSDEALEVFVQYNREDTVNLKPLAETAFNRLREQVVQD